MPPWVGGDVFESTVNSTAYDRNNRHNRGNKNNKRVNPPIYT
jgi:hypothetical protein